MWSVAAFWATEPLSLSYALSAIPAAMCEAAKINNSSLPMFHRPLVLAARPGSTITAIEGRIDPIHMPIIFISAYSDVATTVKAMKAGAVEFLTKPFSDETLLAAIQCAIDRSHELLGYAAEMARLRKCHASLSRRESEVMALVVSGRLNKQVATELGLSEVTVKAHRGKVMRKMNAGSLADLVRMAARLSIVSDPSQHTQKAGSVSRRSIVTAAPTYTVPQEYRT